MDFVMEKRKKLIKYNGMDEIVKIPNGIVWIEEEAFFFRENIKKVIMPDSVKQIGRDAFHFCRSLEEVVFSKNLERIEEEAFALCKSLKQLNLPEKLKYIGDRNFADCSVQEIALPSSVQHIGEGVFSFCDELKTIKVSENNPNYADIDGVLFDKEKKTLISYPRGKKEEIYQVPNSVQKIGNTAFLTARVKKIILPENLTEIEKFAFSSSAVSEIEIPDKVRKIGYGAFFNCSFLKKINIPESVSEIDEEAFKGAQLSEIHVSENNLFYLSEENVLFNKEKTRFIYYSPLKEEKSYQIPDGVECVGEAFCQCENLEEVIFPDSVSELKGMVFKDCKKLKRIIISDKKKSVSMDMIRGCGKLKEIIVRSDKKIKYKIPCYKMMPTTISEMIRHLESGTEESYRKLFLYFNSRQQKMEFVLSVLYYHQDLPESIEAELKQYCSRNAKYILKYCIDHENLEYLKVCAENQVIKKSNILWAIDYARENNKITVSAYLLNYHHELKTKRKLNLEL